jgi:serine/threonine protein kinase
MLNGSPAAQLTDVDPRRLGKWDVQARIGSGGMGVVYKAVCGEDVAAVKVVRPGLLDDPQVAARFEREAQVLRSVQDTHISRFLDADIAGTPAWLATEYIPGPNLRDAVSIWGPLNAERWWGLARGLAQALAVLEIHGIAHRDIKPANVIMADRGPVLIDFGIAHPEDATSLTATGIVTGSPAWLSPEQANLDELSAASDVFSLGSLLAFAATARPPFGQGATVAVLMNIQRGEPDLGSLDPTRAALLDRMLAKDPAKRPSAREVLDIARAVESGDDNTVDLRAPAAHSTQPIRRRRPCDRRRRSVGGASRPPSSRPPCWPLVVGFLGFNALDGDSTQQTGPDATQSQPEQAVAGGAGVPRLGSTAVRRLAALAVRNHAGQRQARDQRHGAEFGIEGCEHRPDGLLLRRRGSGRGGHR